MTSQTKSSTREVAVRATPSVEVSVDNGPFRIVGWTRGGRTARHESYCVGASGHHEDSEQNQSHGSRMMTQQYCQQRSSDSSIE